MSWLDSHWRPRDARDTWPVIPDRHAAERSTGSVANDASGLTDRGRQRERNEDAFALVALEAAGRSPGPPSEPGLPRQLLVVADGVGGSAAGDVASRLAVDTVSSSLGSAGGDRPDRVLRRAVHEADRAIREQAGTAPDLRGMGTTLTAALVDWPRLWVAHAGDSRCYHWRDGRLACLTTDHTVAQRFVEDGILDPDAIPTSSWSGVLWNALGSGDQLHVEELQATLQPGDVLLLCTDGLLRHLEEDEISRLLAGGDDARSTCRRLVETANDRGGSDNITVVLSQFSGLVA